MIPEILNEHPRIEIYQGDCLEIMKTIPDKSIDLVLTDPPYGVTACKWDIRPNIEKLWIELKRIGKDNCAFIFTSSQPFTSILVMSNIKMFKYEFCWHKNKPTSLRLAKIQPIRLHENILIFYKKQCIYNQIKIKRTAIEYKQCYRKNDSKSIDGEYQGSNIFYLKRASAEEQWYKSAVSILQFNKDDKRNGTNHPTQKPVGLMKYLIKVYTNEFNTILDPFMGSGTTLVAAKELNRNAIGIEIEPKYYAIAKRRILNAQTLLFT